VGFTVAAVTGSGVGPASAGISVTIGSPATVTHLKAAKAGNGAIKVSFKAGASNGAAIQSFTATCGSHSATGKASPLTVKGLTAGKSYTCTVSATNSRGKGPSARSNATKA
jgi:large repetitive protein